MPKKTPIHGWHEANGGRMVEYAGFSMPVQYASGIVKEHTAVRQRAGLFDVSHMGEFTLCGPNASEALRRLVTNDCAGMREGQVKYSPMCNERGGTVDDLLIYKKQGGAYMIVVNAANKDKDFAHMRANLTEGATLEDDSDATALIALQGPEAAGILHKLCGPEALPKKNYTFTEGVSVAGASVLASRTGYTGEDGFELYMNPADAPRLWEALLEAGGGSGLIACGLGARDTLRLEAGMPLYGHEMDEEISPVEAGLGVFVKMDKGDFVGREALSHRADVYGRFGLRLLDKGVAREGSAVTIGGEPAGAVTSGTHSVTLGFAIAMARLEKAAVARGGSVAVDVRGRKLAAEICPIPFYKRKKI